MSCKEENHLAFKPSAYIAYVNDIALDGKVSSGIYSFQGRRFLPADKTVLQKLRDLDLSGFSSELLIELVNNDMLVPADIDELQHVEDMLLIQEKLTLLVDCPVSCIPWDVLHNIVRLYGIKNISFILLLNGATDTPVNIISSIRSALKERNISVAVAKYFSLMAGQDELQLDELSANENGGSSVNTYRFSLNGNDPGNSALRSIDQVSLACSNHPWIKELPVSGLLTDTMSMPGLLTRKIAFQCRQCNALAACGGYSGNSMIHCPVSILDPGRTIERKLYTPGHKSDGIPGVSNSLALSNEIAGLFEKIIRENTNLNENLLINYLAKEYNKGFLWSRNGAFDLAALLFRRTDAFAAFHLKDGFCHYYAQAFAASTRSYLAYKTGNLEQAIAITDTGIEACICLQGYRCAGVIILFIAQLLINKSRVLLAAKAYDSWKLVTLENIHFLLNRQLPAGYGSLDLCLFEELEQHLKDGMLMEIINKVLKVNIKSRDFRAGEELINSIEANQPGTGISGQLSAWVGLCIAATERDDVYLEEHFEEFMQEQDEVHNLATLKAYLRILIRKGKRS